MQLVSVANVGPRLFAHFRDGRGIETADFRQHSFRQHPAHFDGARAPLFQRSIVKVRVRIGVEYFVRELRRYGRIDGDATNAAIADCRKHVAQAVDVHGLGKGFSHRLSHQRMIGNGNVALNIFLTRSRFRKYRREQVVRPHALNLWRDFLAMIESEQGEGASYHPTPPGGEYRRRQNRLLEDRLHRFRMKEMKDVCQRKTVLHTERDI